MPAAAKFQLTPAQQTARTLLVGPATHVMLAGGSRSGKTFVIVRDMMIRAIMCPGARQAIFRHRFNHVRASVGMETAPRVMALCWPNYPYRLSKTDWIIYFHNGSELILAGLDDRARTEKILGREFCGVAINEASQISYDSRNMVITRLAQNCGLPLKEYVDLNPTSVASWPYKLWIAKKEPRSGATLADPSDYAWMRLNPIDNPHLPEQYLKGLAELPERDRLRFLSGEWQSEVPNALWSQDRLDELRIARDQIPTMRRVVVAVDPSGCSGPEDRRSDEIGIVVAGVGHDGNGYVIADRSGRYSPRGWAQAVLNAFDAFAADAIIAEQNFGGAMVESNIRTERKHAPVKLVVASRGKAQRAEPVAALYEQRRVKHVGTFPDLESQLLEFSSAGYQGASSPDRADALVWAMHDLMVQPGSLLYLPAA